MGQSFIGASKNMRRRLNPLPLPRVPQGGVGGGVGLLSPPFFVKINFCPMLSWWFIFYDFPFQNLIQCWAPPMKIPWCKGVIFLLKKFTGGQETFVDVSWPDDAQKKDRRKVKYHQMQDFFFRKQILGGNILLKWMRNQVYFEKNCRKYCLASDGLISPWIVWHDWIKISHEAGSKWVTGGSFGSFTAARAARGGYRQSCRVFA